MNLSNWI